MEKSKISLHVQRFTSTNKVMMLHGFTGTYESMQELSELLPYDCATPDLIGHGRSPCPTNHFPYRIKEIIKQLDGVAEEYLCKPFNIIGYSMGARIALSYAADRQDSLQSVVLIGGTAGIENDQDRHLRAVHDSGIAAKIEDHGLEHFVNFWEKRPIFASQRLLSLEKQEKIRRIRLRHQTCGLANHLRLAGTGMMDSLWQKLQDIEVPILLIAGQKDQKYVEIAESMVSELPNAEINIVVGAGHAVHYEKPEETAEIISQFLRKTRTY